MKKRRIVLIAFVFFLVFVSLNIVLKTELGKFLSFNLFGNNELSYEEKLWLENHEDLIYGADENSPPLMFVDEETSQYTGFTIDYVNALSLELGSEIKTKSYVWDEALETQIYATCFLQRKGPECMIFQTPFIVLRVL